MQAVERVDLRAAAVCRAYVRARACAGRALASASARTPTCARARESGRSRVRTLSTPAHCARSPARGGRLPGSLGRALAPLALPCGGALPGNRSGSCSGGGRRGGGVAAEQVHVSRVGANAGRLVRTGQSSSCARAAAEPDCSATRRESVTHTRVRAAHPLERPRRWRAEGVRGGGRARSALARPLARRERTHLSPPLLASPVEPFRRDCATGAAATSIDRPHARLCERALRRPHPLCPRLRVARGRLRLLGGTDRNRRVRPDDEPCATPRTHRPWVNYMLI